MVRVAIVTSLTFAAFAAAQSTLGQLGDACIGNIECATGCCAIDTQACADRATAEEGGGCGFNGISAKKRHWRRHDRRQSVFDGVEDEDLPDGFGRNADGQVINFTGEADDGTGSASRPDKTRRSSHPERRQSVFDGVADEDLPDGFGRNANGQVINFTGEADDGTGSASRPDKKRHSRRQSVFDGVADEDLPDGFGRNANGQVINFTGEADDGTGSASLGK